MGGRPSIPAPPPPPPPPDYTDQAVRDAALAERQKSLSGSSRRKSFITSSGSSLDAGPGTGPAVAAPSLSGTMTASALSAGRKFFIRR